MLLNRGIRDSPLNCKEIKPVNPKGNQSWIFIGRTDAEAKNPILWPPDAKHWLFGKDPNTGKDWRQEDKGMTEEKMVGWHHQLDGYETEQALGVRVGQGSLACCSPWGHTESDRTAQLNNNSNNGVCSNSCPSIRWFHPTISSSVVPLSFCLRSFPAS